MTCNLARKKSTSDIEITFTVNKAIKKKNTVFLKSKKLMSNPNYILKVFLLPTFILGFNASSSVTLPCASVTPPCATERIFLVFSTDPSPRATALVMASTYGKQVPLINSWKLRKRKKNHMEPRRLHKNFGSSTARVLSMTRFPYAENSFLPIVGSYLKSVRSRHLLMI